MNCNMTNTSNITNMNYFNDQSVLAKLTGLDYLGLDQLDLDHVKKDISLSFIEYVVNQVFLEIGSFHNENVYREAMLYEFRSKGYTVSSEVSVPIKYKDTLLSYVHGRIDILLENDIVIELKAISTKDLGLATQQCKSYMKCLNKSKGYVINFSKTEKGRPVIQEITLDETNTCAENDIREISKGIQQNNKTIELILQKMENLEICIRGIHEKHENVPPNHLTNDIEIIKMQLNNLHINAMKKDNIVLLIDEKEKDATDAETDAETEDEDKEAEADTDSEAETEEEPQAEAETEKEPQADEYETEEEPQADEAECEPDAEPEPAEPSAEEEEEELFEIEIDDITYCTNNEETGVIYEVLKDGNVGKAVGYLKDGEPIFT